MPALIRRLSLGLCLAVVLGFVSPLAAQQKFDPAARAAAIAPYIDDLTVAVVHLDPQRVDFDKMVEKIKASELRPTQSDEEFNTGMAFAGALVKTVKERIVDGYVVISLADVPLEPPFAVLNLQGDTEPKDVLNMIVSPLLEMEVSDELFAKHTIVQGRTLIVGGERTIGRLKRLKPTPQPELERAFQVAGDTTAQVVAFTSEGNRAMLARLIGDPPPPFGEVKGEELAESIRFLALGIDALPNEQIRFGLQAKDAESARRLYGAIAVGVENIIKLESIPPQQQRLLRSLLPTLKEDRLFKVLNTATLVGIQAEMEQEVIRAKEFARRLESSNNLKQIGLAMHNHHDTYTELPPHRGVKLDKDGKPLLSWRVYILPFIEEQALFERFHLDEPWDSEHNKPLAELMPRVLRNSNVKLDSKMHTTYVLPIHAKSMFNGKTGLSFGDVRDGLSNTIMALEVRPENAVIWTKPDDWEVNADKPLEGLGKLTDQGIWAAFGDGSVQQILPQADPAEFLKMLLRNDGEPVKFEKLKLK